MVREEGPAESSSPFLRRVLLDCREFFESYDEHWLRALSSASGKSLPSDSGSQKLTSPRGRDFRLYLTALFRQPLHPPPTPSTTQVAASEGTPLADAGSEASLEYIGSDEEAELEHGERDVDEVGREEVKGEVEGLGRDGKHVIRGRLSSKSEPTKPSPPLEGLLIPEAFLMRYCSEFYPDLDFRAFKLGLESAIQNAELLCWRFPQLSPDARFFADRFAVMQAVREKMWKRASQEGLIIDAKDRSLSESRRKAQREATAHLEALFSVIERKTELGLGTADFLSADFDLQQDLNADESSVSELEIDEHFLVRAGVLRQLPQSLPSPQSRSPSSHFGPSSDRQSINHRYELIYPYGPEFWYPLQESATWLLATLRRALRRRTSLTVKTSDLIPPVQKHWQMKEAKKEAKKKGGARAQADDSSFPAPAAPTSPLIFALAVLESCSVLCLDKFMQVGESLTFFDAA